MGEGGRAFGSVSSKEIAEEVKKQMDLTIDKKKVQLKEAIRTLGTHTVPVKLDKMPSPLQEKSSVVMIFIRRHME